jgi:hypothetical protein
VQDVDVFFWEGRGMGNGTPGRVLLRRYHRTTRVPNSPGCMLYIIC